MFLVCVQEDFECRNALLGQNMVSTSADDDARLLCQIQNDFFLCLVDAVIGILRGGKGFQTFQRALHRGDVLPVDGLAGHAAVAEVAVERVSAEQAAAALVEEGDLGGRVAGTGDGLDEAAAEVEFHARFQRQGCLSKGVMSRSATQG